MLRVIAALVTRYFALNMIQSADDNFGTFVEQKRDPVVYTTTERHMRELGKIS
jgi:hypothetical protein